MTLTDLIVGARNWGGMTPYEDSLSSPSIPLRPRADFRSFAIYVCSEMDRGAHVSFHKMRVAGEIGGKNQTGPAFQLAISIKIYVSSGNPCGFTHRTWGSVWRGRILEDELSTRSTFSLTKETGAAILVKMNDNKVMSWEELFDGDWLTGKNAIYTSEYASELEYTLAN